MIKQGGAQSAMLDGEILMQQCSVDKQALLMVKHIRRCKHCVVIIERIVNHQLNNLSVLVVGIFDNFLWAFYAPGSI